METKDVINLFHTKPSPGDKALVMEILDSGNLVMGAHIAAFEAELEAFFGSGGVACCGSGTDALTLIMEELGCENTAVIVPAMTFSATYEAVLKARATPIVCDVEVDTLTPSLKGIRDAMVGAIYNGQAVSAIILVHLYGWPAAELIEIRDFCEAQNIILIEDCAQAFGATAGNKMVGTFGDAAAFSFYPTKPLGGIGDGGAALFRRPDIAVNARARRNHGRQDGIQVSAGYNSRLDETNAAVLRNRLMQYSEAAATRVRLAERYKQNGLRKLSLKTNGGGIPYVYPVLVDNREAIRFSLAEIGVETRVHYDPPVSGLPYVNANCPNAKWVSRRVLSLPCHQGMKLEDVDRISDALRA